MYMGRYICSFTWPLQVPPSHDASSLSLPSSGLHGPRTMDHYHYKVSRERNKEEGEMGRRKGREGQRKGRGWRMLENQNQSC